MLGTDKKELHIEEEKVVHKNSQRRLSYEDIAYNATYAENQFQIQAQASYTASESPPPFIAQFAEVDVDKRTGKVNVVITQIPQRSIFAPERVNNRLSDRSIPR